MLEQCCLLPGTTSADRSVRRSAPERVSFGTDGSPAAIGRAPIRMAELEPGDGGPAPPLEAAPMARSAVGQPWPDSAHRVFRRLLRVSDRHRRLLLAGKRPPGMDSQPGGRAVCGRDTRRVRDCWRYRQGNPAIELRHPDGDKEEMGPQ